MPPFYVTKPGKKLLNLENDESALIKGILNDDDITIRKIYKMNFLKIKILVRSFRNFILEPDEIFQEGLVQSIINIKAGKFKGQSKYETYLYGICKNICLKKLRGHQYTQSIDNIEIKDDIEGIDFDLINRVVSAKNEMGVDCKQIVDLRFGFEQGVNTDKKTSRFEFIATKLGISVANARQRFKRCLDKLKNLLTNDALFSELTI